MHDKTNIMTCVPRDDSDQPGHPPTRLNQSSLCAICVAKDLRFFHADSEDYDLSLHWAHTSFYWFCHAVAQILLCSGLLACLKILCSSSFSDETLSRSLVSMIKFSGTFKLSQSEESFKFQ